jgi:hypothetical protein
VRRPVTIEPLVRKGFAETCPDPTEKANPRGQVDDKATIETSDERRFFANENRAGRISIFRRVRNLPD